MKFSLVVLLLLSFTLHTYAQPPASAYTTTDSVTLHIPDSLTRSTDGIVRYITANFNTEDERTRAAFIWTASNICYDVAKAMSPDIFTLPPDKIPVTLSTRLGVCENYADVFTELCSKMGIRAYIVPGYTKKNNEVSTVPHAWCAAMVDDAWYLFDPTWSGGYVQNNQFVKRYNNQFYKVPPDVMITHHMPFDPMWQLLDFTLSNDEFTSGTPNPAVRKAHFAYKDSVDAWDHQSRNEQLLNMERRIKNNGGTNSAVRERLRQIKLELDQLQTVADAQKSNENADVYNAAINDYNSAVKYYNDYIDYYNHQFSPTRPDSDIQAMLSNADIRITRALAQLGKSTATGTVSPSMMRNSKKTMEQIAANINQQKKFLVKYFSTPSANRKKLFVAR